MKKPILVFALKCFTIIYITAFTDIDKITIAPNATHEVNNDKAEANSTNSKFVSIQNSIPTGNLYMMTHL
jgi:hypothetical protein